MTWEGWLALAAALIATVSLGLGLSHRARAFVKLAEICLG